MAKLYLVALLTCVMAMETRAALPFGTITLGFSSGTSSWISRLELRAEYLDVREPCASSGLGAAELLYGTICRIDGGVRDLRRAESMAIPIPLPNAPGGGTPCSRGARAPGNTMVLDEPVLG